MKTWFISDLHFHHKNILKYEPSRIDATIDYIANKYYYSTEQIEEAREQLTAALNDNNKDIIDVYLVEHDNMLVDNWNKIVKSDDIVWFLGDLSLGDREYTRRLCGRLHGHKKMIMGNHDQWTEHTYYECGFEFVSRYPIILKHFFVLSHAPLEGMSDNIPFFNIFGHVHSSPYIMTKTEHSQCVCVERQNFMPVTIPEYDSYVEVKKEYE